MAEQAPRWRFARMIPAQINEDPVQGEFFTSSVADLPERLVREAIQNSMDATVSLGDRSVRVRFFFGNDPLPPHRSQPYLDGLREHMAESLPSGTAELLAEPMPWMAIEDFHTKGLTGQIDASDAKGRGNNFWGFFRQIGISTKGESEGGSWGLGKWVFPDASQLNSFLALTRRTSESRTLMMGLAVLKTHSIGNAKYPAYGHFAEHSDLDDTEWLQMPVDSSQDAPFVERAIDDFGLERGASSGLSVIVPWPKEELTPDSIARAVISQYFLPIISGDLEVEIASPAGTEHQITQESIHRELAQLSDAEMGNAEQSKASVAMLLRLAEWAVTVAGNEHNAIPLTGVSTADSDAFNQFNFDELRDRFERGERLAIRQTVGTTRRDASDDQGQEESEFHLYLERDENLEAGHDYFVRGHLQIPAMDHIRNFRARALVLVRGDAELGRMLRDSEGPAHTKWDPQAERLKQGWTGGQTRVNAVRRAPLTILRKLTERPAERQLDALADLFPANIPSRTSPKVVNGENCGSHPPPPPSKPSPVSLKPVTAGFSLAPNRPFPLSVIGTTWSVRFAYELARGSKNKAFAQFDSGLKDGCPDFSLEDGLKHESSGCSLEIVAPNRLTLSIDSDDFRLTVTGFDKHRDVLVEVNQIQSDEGESE